jgi:hypothetical protein
LPDYDRDRVYVSDIRKIALWYNLLQKLELLVKEEEKVEEAKDSPAETEVVKTEAKPAGKKKSAAAAAKKKQ